MSKFEPPVDPMTQPPVKDQKRQFALEYDYSDDELLIELRRRGRIERVAVMDTLPGHVADHYDEGMQFRALAGHLGRGIAEHLNDVRRIPGAEVNTVRGVPGDTMHTSGRRMRFALNFVVVKS